MRKALKQSIVRDPPPPTPIAWFVKILPMANHIAEAWDLTFSFVPSLVLKSALLLKIPDIIWRAGPDSFLSVREIAAQLPTNNPQLDYLSRILRYLSTKSVFSVQSIACDQEEVRYGLTHLSKLYFVTHNNPFSLVPLVLFQTHEAFQAPWHHFHECVLGGCGAFEKAHGKDIWAYGKDDPHVGDIINSAMTSLTRILMKQVLDCYDGFNDFKTVVDVGGGTGIALKQIIDAFPHVRGINFDQPHVISTAPPFPGVEHVGGNVFDSVPHADAIFLKNVLVDWNDEQCVKILEKCYQALPGNGKVILAEIVLRPNQSNAYLADIQMIAYTNGKQRSEEEYKALLQNSGFSHVKFFGGPQFLMYVVEGTKANTNTNTNTPVNANAVI